MRLLSDAELASGFDDDAPPRPKRSSMRCQCGLDMPGTCPGPTNCPYSGLDDDDSEPPNGER